MPTVPCMGTTTVPCLGTSTVPCLGTFASALPGHVCSPCLGRLPVPCLGTLASSLPGNACQCACPAWACLQSLPGTLASSLPGNACQFPAWERLPVPCLGTFASALPGHVLQSLPGTLCQFPAWERLPMPCLGMFASPCLGRLPVPCLGTPFAGTPSLAELFSYAYRTSRRGELLRLFKPEMPRTPVPCYFCICNERQVKRMQIQGKKNKQQLVKKGGRCVRMRQQEEGGVEGGLVCSCSKQKQMSKSEGC